MLEEKLGYTYLLIALVTFFFVCSNELFSDPTTEILASIFSAILWTLYWVLVYFEIEHPAITLLSGWLIIGTILMGIFIAYDKVTRMWRK